MTIRIRFEFTRYPHWGNQSGFTQLARHLDAKRYEAYLHGASDNDDDLPLPIPPVRRWLRRWVQRSGMAWYKLSDLAAELQALPGCLTNRFQIIHFLDAEHSAQYLPRLVKASRFCRTRTVATFHQPPDLLDRLVNRDALNWIDHVTVVSPSQLPFFSDFLPDDRLHVLFHGIDTAFFHPPAARNLGHRICCVTAGHWLRDWTAMHQVAAILRDEQDISFHIITNRPTGLDHLPNVFHYRDVSDAAMAELYRRADVLFLPLLDATANNTLLEGIASGLPVVASALPAVKAYLPGSEGILVGGNEPEGFAAALRRLQFDTNLRMEMAAQARARAEQLSWTNVATQYAALYDKIL